MNRKDIFYNFPYDIIPLREELSKRIMLDFTGERTGFVQVGPQKYFFPYKFLTQADNYYNVELRDDDIWVVSFPRSGTTITQELVWLIANDLDFKKASSIPLVQRFPFFEFGLFFHDDVKKEFLQNNSHSKINQQSIENMSKHGWEFLPEMPSPRFIKTHFPFSMLPKDWSKKKCKTIYVGRNVKDVIVSFYHLNRLFKTQGYAGSFSKYLEYFQEDLQPWSPYWNHIEEGWKHQNDPNILLLFYENIIQDMRGIIKKVATFLDKKLSDENIERLVNYLDFKNFQKNDAVSSEFLRELKITNSKEQGFIRKGKINGNSDEFTPETSAEVQEWIEENLRKMNIQFPRWNS